MSKGFWHAFGGYVANHPIEPGVWIQITFGPVEQQEPPEAPPGGTIFPELVYLATWDHEPTEAEKDALEPDDGWLDGAL